MDINRVRPIRTALAALWLVGVLMLSSGVAAAAASGITTLPPQGLYEECAPSDQQQCAGELGRMSGAGFQLALNYTAWYGSAADIEAYAATAAADGIELIWPLNDVAWRGGASLVSTYPELAADCGCSTNAQFTAYAVNLVKSLPATWGYYTGDELPASDAQEEAQLSSTVRLLDPAHPQLLIASGYSNLTASLTPFLSNVNVIGADPYPVGAGRALSFVSQAAATVAHEAQDAHRQSAIVLQAFSWSEYPSEIKMTNPHFPTLEEMRTMRNEALVYHPSLILWYSLSDIQKSTDPAGNWQNLVAAAFGQVPAPIASAAAAHHRARHGRRRSIKRTTRRRPSSTLVSSR